MTEKQARIYSLYLGTEHWLDKKQFALEKANYKCQTCSSKENLQVHHNTYENITFEAEEDLFVMCNSCHLLFHSLCNLQGKQLHEIDYKFLEDFVKSQSTEDIDGWYLKLDGKLMLKPSKYPFPEIYPNKLSPENYDLIVEEFNCLNNSNRNQIYKRGINSWIAFKLKKLRG